MVPVLFWREDITATPASNKPLTVEEIVKPNPVASVWLAIDLARYAARGQAVVG